MQSLDVWQELQCRAAAVRRGGGYRSGGAYGRAVDGHRIEYGRLALAPGSLLRTLERRPPSAYRGLGAGWRAANTDPATWA